MPARTNLILPGGASGPAIAIIDGIKIQMYFRDHAPSHFHAILGTDEALIDIQTLAVMAGSLPQARLNRVIVWARANQQGLARNWEPCQNDQRPEPL